MRPAATSRRRSARAWPRPRSRRSSTAPRSTSTGPIDHDATVAIITANSDEGREVLRHSTSHLMAQAVFDLFPGAKYAIGPAIADGFYYDFELPDGQHFSETDLERIEARMREIVAEDEPFVREEYDFDRGLELFADQPFKQEIIRNVSSGAAERGRRGRGHRRRHGRRLQEPARRRQRRVRRPVPRSARPVDRQARRVQADEGRGRVLAGRREAPDAPADLRHRVGERQGAEGVPAPARGGRAPRPPQARRRARPLLVPGRDRLRARGLPSEGRHGPPDHGGVLAASATSTRATTSSTRRTSRSRTSSRRAGTSTGTPTACTRRWSSTAARTTTSSR